MVILRKPVPGLTEAALVRFLQRAGRSVGLPGLVNVLVTTNKELQSLNRRFCGKDRPTDVLSFPPMPGLVAGLAGDIAISSEIAAQNAAELGHSAALEVKILALHGILHLAGYDHESDQGAMARQEMKLRKSLGLPSGLIERVGLPAARNRSGKRKPPKSRTLPSPKR